MTKVYDVTIEVPAKEVRFRIGEAIEDGATLAFEDGGMAVIVEPEPEPDPHFFIRLHSYDPTSGHPLMRSIMGKRVRVTVEVLDGQ